MWRLFIPAGRRFSCKVLVLLLSIQHLGFMAVAVNRVFGNFEANSAVVAERFSEEGKGQLQKIQSETGSCWKDGYSELVDSCRVILRNDDKKARLALHFTRCMLQNSNVGLPCTPQMSAKECTEYLHKHEINTWTTYFGYFNNLDAMCHHLQNELFYERVEGAVHQLQRGVFESIQGLAAMQEQSHAAAVTMRQVSDGQQRLLEGQQALGASVRQDFDRLGALALELGDGLQNVSAEQARLRVQNTEAARAALSSLASLQDATGDVRLALGDALEGQRRLLAAQSAAVEGLEQLRGEQEAAFSEQGRAVHALGSAAWEYHQQQRAAHSELARLQGELVNGSHELARAQASFLRDQRHLFQALAGLSALHGRLVADLSSFKRLGFYTGATVLCYLVTATPRTRGARFWLYAGLGSTLAAEWDAQGALGAAAWRWRSGPLCQLNAAGVAHASWADTAAYSGWGVRALLARALGSIAAHLPDGGPDGWGWMSESKAGEGLGHNQGRGGDWEADVLAEVAEEARQRGNTGEGASTTPDGSDSHLRRCPPLDPHELDEYYRCCRLAFASWACVMLLYAVVTFRDYAALSFALLARQQQSLAVVQDTLADLSRTVSSLSQRQQQAAAEAKPFLAHAASGCASDGMLASAGQGELMLVYEGEPQGAPHQEAAAAASSPGLGQVHGREGRSCPHCDWDLGKAATVGAPSGAARGRRGSLWRRLLQKLAWGVCQGLARLWQSGIAGVTQSCGRPEASAGLVVGGMGSDPGCYQGLNGGGDTDSSSDEDYVPESPLSEHMSGDDSCALPARKAYDLRPRHSAQALRESHHPSEGHNPILALESAKDFARLVHLNWLFTANAYDFVGESCSSADDENAVEGDHDSDSWLDFVTDEDSCSENDGADGQAVGDKSYVEANMV